MKPIDEPFFWLEVISIIVLGVVYLLLSSGAATTALLLWLR